MTNKEIFENNEDIEIIENLEEAVGGREREFDKLEYGPEVDPNCGECNGKKYIALSPRGLWLVGYLRQIVRENGVIVWQMKPVAGIEISGAYVACSTKSGWRFYEYIGK